MTFEASDSGQIKIKIKIKSKIKSKKTRTRFHVFVTSWELHPSCAIFTLGTVLVV